MQVPPLDRVPRRSEVLLPPLDSPFQAPGYRSVQPVSISLPASPNGFGVMPAIPVAANGAAAGDSADGLRRQALLANAAAAREPQPLTPPPPARQNGGGSVRFTHQPADKVVFRSQPIPGGQPPRAGSRVARAASRVLSRDKRYDSFKTFSGKLERQLTHLAGAPEVHEEEEEDEVVAITSRTTSMPKVERFFAALEGPELDKLKVRARSLFPFFEYSLRPKTDKQTSKIVLNHTILLSI
jgi:hypothetical protein